MKKNILSEEDFSRTFGKLYNDKKTSDITIKFENSNTELFLHKFLIFSLSKILHDLYKENKEIIIKENEEIFIKVI
jgi:hypothetical protein